MNARKANLKDLWSKYHTKATALDHAIYFALYAVLGKPETRKLSYDEQFKAAFRETSNHNKLVNGHISVPSILRGEIVYLRSGSVKQSLSKGLRVRSGELQNGSLDGFLGLAINSVTKEDLEEAVKIT